jgi:hypothetical protein
MSILLRLPDQRVAPLQADGSFNRQWYIPLSGLVDAVNAITLNPTWNPVTLLHGWTAAGLTVFGTPGYSLDSLNILRFRGRISGGTITDGTVLFNLPAGFIPPFDTHAVILANPVTFATYNAAHLFIVAFTGGGYTAGDVVLFGAPAATTALTLDASFPLY